MDAPGNNSTDRLSAVGANSNDSDGGDTTDEVMPPLMNNTSTTADSSTSSPDGRQSPARTSAGNELFVFQANTMSPLMGTRTTADSSSSSNSGQSATSQGLTNGSQPRRIVRAIRPPPSGRNAENEPKEEDESEDDHEDESEDDSEYEIEDESEDDSEDESFDEEEEDNDDHSIDEADFPFLPGYFEMMRLLESADSDDDRCDCPQCRGALGHYYAMLHARRTISETWPEEDGGDEGYNSDPDAPICAVCLEPENPSRPLVVLPCCGGDKETSSSTRFCRACVRKCLLNDGQDYSSVGECPRCKHLLRDNRDGTLEKADIRDALPYITGRDGGEYRLFLLVMAWSYAGYLPEELLSPSSNSQENEDNIRRMVQWGFLRKHAGMVYSIDASDQAIIREWCTNHLKPTLDGEVEMVSIFTAVPKDNQNRQYLLTACVYFHSSWSALVDSYRIWRCLRLLNQCLTLALLAITTGYALPSMQQWSVPPPVAGFLTTTLNFFVVYLLLKILLELLYILMYFVLGLAASTAVGMVLARSSPTSWGKLNKLVAGATTIGLLLYVALPLYKGWRNPNDETVVE